MLDGEIIGEAEDGGGQDRFLALEPTAGDKDFVEGEADFGFEFRPGDFFGEGAVETEEAIGGDGAGFGVGFGEGEGVRIGAVVNNDGMGGEIGRRGGFGTGRQREEAKKKGGPERRERHRGKNRREGDGRKSLEREFKGVVSKVDGGGEGGVALGVEG